MINVLLLLNVPLGHIILLPWRRLLIIEESFCFVGLHTYGDRYKEMIYRVQCSYGSPQKMEGPTLDKIHDELAARIPMDQLNERRKWRDLRLASLQKLKNDLDKK